MEATREWAEAERGGEAWRVADRGRAPCPGCYSAERLPHSCTTFLLTLLWTLCYSTSALTLSANAEIQNDGGINAAKNSGKELRSREKG